MRLFAHRKGVSVPVHLQAFSIIPECDEETTFSGHAELLIWTKLSLCFNNKKNSSDIFLLAGKHLSWCEKVQRWNCRWMLPSHVNWGKENSYMFFFFFPATKGCNLFGLESCSSKRSADNSPEVSFKRVSLFNYFLRDLQRQCDNETVSFTCDSDPPQPDTQSQIVLFTESFPFTLTQQIHLTDFSVGCRAGAASDVPAECDWIERLCHRSSCLISCVWQKKKKQAWRFGCRRSDSYHFWPVAFFMNPKSLFDCFARLRLYVRCSVMDNTQGRSVPFQQRRSHYHKPNAIHLCKRVCLRIGRTLPDVGQHMCTGL